MEYDIHPEPLAAMRERGGKWAAYCNMDIGSSALGHFKYLCHGKGCTFEKPPKQLPDTPSEINWRYQYVGEVNLESGEVDT